MGAVTGQATHVASVVPPAPPGMMRTIPGVALQTRFVGLRRGHLGRISNIRGFPSLDVFGAVAVATLARRSARIGEEFGAFAVSVQGEGFDNELVAPQAPRSNHGLLNGLTRGLRLGRGLDSGPRGLHKGREKADKGYNHQ